MSPTVRRSRRRHVGARPRRGPWIRSLISLVTCGMTWTVPPGSARALLSMTLVDLAGGHVASCGQVSFDEPLVVAEVEVGLGAVIGDEDLAVLVGSSSPVDVKVRVVRKKTDSWRALQDVPDRGGGDALSQRAHHSTCDENVLGHPDTGPRVYPVGVTPAATAQARGSSRTTLVSPSPLDSPGRSASVAAPGSPRPSPPGIGRSAGARRGAGEARSASAPRSAARSAGPPRRPASRPAWPHRRPGPAARRPSPAIPGTGRRAGDRGRPGGNADVVDVER